MQRVLEGKRLLLPVAALTLIAVAATIYLADSYHAALPALMSPTAHVAFALFSLAFATSSLFRLLPTPFTRYLMRNRRYVGLGFALVHFTHLVLVLTNITMVPGESREIATLVPGAIAYAFLALMTLTSNDISVRTLGIKRWKFLHKVGSYYIWLIFFATTLPPAANSAWMLIASLTVLTLRIAAYQKQKLKKKARPTV